MVIRTDRARLVFVDRQLAAGHVGRLSDDDLWTWASRAARADPDLCAFLNFVLGLKCKGHAKRRARQVFPQK